MDGKINATTACLKDAAFSILIARAPAVTHALSTAASAPLSAQTISITLPGCHTQPTDGKQVVDGGGKRENACLTETRLKYPVYEWNHMHTHEIPFSVQVVHA